MLVNPNGAPLGSGAPQILLPAKAQLELPRLEESLGLFTERGWRHALEPKTYRTNWHIDCMCDHLTAVVDLDPALTKGPLIFCIPPRHMKSITAQVFLPGWLWAQDPDPKKTGHGLGVRPGTLRGPGAKLAFISYAQPLSNDMSIRCRALLQSDWYRARWNSRFTIGYDQIEWFQNSWGGDRRALSFGGKITGFGADIIFVDDPHNIKDTESPEVREKTLWLYRDVLQSRLNDGEGIFVIIMQRSHERDLVGDILSREFNGTLVCLPAEYEAKHPHAFSSSTVKRATASDPAGGPAKGELWRDTRNEGEVLWHSRFPKERLHKIIKDSGMTAHAVAGQYQQRPSAREGGMFKRQSFLNPVKIDPRFSSKNLVLVRAWDFAHTGQDKAANNPDYTVGLLMALDLDTRLLYVIDVIRERVTPLQRQLLVVTTAALDGEGVLIRIPQDPGGQFDAHYLVGQLQGYNVTIEPEHDSKEARAEPFASQCENFMVKLVEADWNEIYIDELCAFPNGAHKDQVDASSAAFRALIRRPSYSAAAA